MEKKALAQNALVFITLEYLVEKEALRTISNLRFKGHAKNVFSILNLNNLSEVKIPKIKSSTYWSQHNQWIQECCMHVYYPWVCRYPLEQCLYKNHRHFSLTPSFLVLHVKAPFTNYIFWTFQQGITKTGLSCTWKWTTQSATQVFVYVWG